MLFITLFILYLKFNLNFSKSVDKSFVNKLKFVKNVNQFCLKTNPEGAKFGNVKNTYSFTLGVYKDGTILGPVISIFEDDLIILIQQLNNYYYKSLPKLNFVKDNYKKKNNILHTVSIQSNYIQTICTYMPPCLNFIYLIKGKRSVLSLLYNYHTRLCAMFPRLLTKKCFPDKKNRELYKCDNKTIIAFYEQILFQESKQTYMKNDYQEMSMTFIFNIYVIIENIDKMSLIKENPLLYENILNNIPNHHWSYEITSTYQGNELIKNEKNENLIKKMIEINKNHLDKLVNKCNVSTGQLKNEMPSLKPYSLTKKLLLYTFKRLEKYFEFFVLTPEYTLFSNNSNMGLNKNDIQMLVSEIFGKLCNFIPLILFYTNNNEEIDTTLFSMYFTFCGNYTSLINVQCPNLNKYDKNMSYGKSCVIKAIKEKIQINFLSITGEVSKIDKYVNEPTCTESNFEYVKKIYDILSEYFNGTFIPLWTTYDWISGKHFLINDYKSEGMKNLKLETINIANVPITLPNVLINMMPWNANKKTIFTFQSILFYKINMILDTYLYRTAQIIMLFIKHVNFKVNTESLVPLRSSINWYKYALDVFYKYLCLRENNDIFQKGVVLISIIEKFNDASIVDNVNNIIPSSIKFELKVWFEVELNHNDGDNVNDKFNKIAKNNCKNAMDFVNDLVSILVESNVMQKANKIHLLKLYEMYCVNIN